ncbi:helix-turn-helix domain-containing protein [Ornithinimicrobium murale]|uniref:helix-turn-helix domain-containing protein n=1 Tax=Ornithinimicrobium murale TaxID=1050153 RepID=UPI0013B3D311|nr:helix-turn-helix domain-containing protein [Ornithinimicrobium murale]
MLEPIGLSTAEESVYDALVRRAQADTAELAEDARESPETTRRALRRLVDLGLATRGGGRPVRYLAAPPDTAIETLLRDREDGIRSVRQQVHSLMESYRAGTRFNYPTDLIEVIVGRQELGQRWEQMQRSARVQVRGFDAPPYSAPQGRRESNPVELDLLARGVQYRVVYDKQAIVLPGWLDDVTMGMKQGEQARISLHVPVKLAIADDRMAIIPLLRTGDDAVTASYLIHPSPLLEALAALFESVWESSVPVRQAMKGTPVVPDDALSDDEAELLTLLAAGLTDAAVGRSMQWSERTVQRHVQRLMARLGVQTRFQVGLEANRRGWI